jgi:hypothetical protein
MSGLVASRFYSLLPAYMPIEKKYSLVESLWKHCGSTSSKTYYVGLNATAEELYELIVKFFEKRINEYKIDQILSNRFKWLAENDSNLQQNLQNHFLKLERKLMGEVSIARIK